MDMEYQAGVEAGPSNSYRQIVYCKWDYCSEIFATFQEWDQHLVVDHMAYERAVDLRGRKVRRRADGIKELVDDGEFDIQHELPLQPIDPDTTTTTTHTLSHPLPPSFQSLPDPPTQSQLHSSSMPTNLILPPRSSPGHEMDHEPISTGQSYEGIFQNYMGSRTPSPSPSPSITSSPQTGAQAEMLPPANQPSPSHGRSTSNRRYQTGPSGNAHTSFFSPINSDFSGIQSIPLSHSQITSTPSSSLNNQPQSQSTGGGSSSAPDVPQRPRESPPRIDQSSPQQYNTPSQSGLSLAFGAALMGDDGQAFTMGTPAANGSPLALANRTAPTTRGGGRGRKSSLEGVAWQWGAGS